jgi:hypothetical protein
LFGGVAPAYGRGMTPTRIILYLMLAFIVVFAIRVFLSRR